MDEVRHLSTDGSRGTIVVHEWSNDDPTWIAVLVHGYGEHLGRYPHVAERLRADGAVVVGPDHEGHGRSDGERVLITDFETVVDDLHSVVTRARETYAGLPVVMVGHSLGGLIATRYAQRHRDELTALVLSGPVIGSWHPTALADLPEIPDDPLDVSTLSRDAAVGVAYAADPLVWHGPFKRETLRAITSMLRTINEGGDLGTLPTLWLHGGADELVPIGPSREGIETIRGGEFSEHVYDGARHEIFNETNQNDVLDDAVAFVRAHLG
ncbi:alpha/beta hydrolase [Solicola gregarius]|uniref:Alpha/beta hydrolase n=1 Tax=Solicola gregarius TaxID=2908642 RepID=A0AA46TN17_9ACTN|nr:alpha/beta hydrolase [Solicola gregarius]UYM07388.1 alpha/beta hydrolase [Solicola gregarius]